MTTQHSASTIMKFTGSLALLLTVVGILLAIGGQLDFLGNERPQPAGKASAAGKPDEVNGHKPKYSFYDELKKRKTELDNQRQQTVTQQNKAQQAQTEQYRYVVQVGAFRYEKDANIIKGKVSSLGYPVRIAKGSGKYLVQAGPFQGRAKADTAEKRLRGQKMDTLIKRLQ